MSGLHRLAGETPGVAAWSAILVAGLLGPNRAAIAADAPTARPEGQVTAAPEWGPVDGMLFAYEGPGSWKTIIDTLIAGVTTVGDADAWIYVDTLAERTELMTFAAAAGADLDRVHPIVRPTDSIWMRDYGPRYAFEDGVRVIADHVYNRPRPDDDSVPSDWSNLRNQARYDLPLVHGGGNLHLIGSQFGAATQLLPDENPGLSLAELDETLDEWLGVDLLLFDSLPATVDATRQIDTYVLPVDADTVLVSDWPFDVGGPADLVCDLVAGQLALSGQTVIRIPARFSAGVHFTYTEALICNEVVFVPSFDANAAAAIEAEAMAVFAAAFPDHQIVPVDADAIAAAGGTLHSIALPVPAFAGGDAPAVRVVTPRPGAMLTVGQPVEITWISDDDDAATTTADLLLSLDGGVTYTFLVAVNTPDDGRFTWSPPNLAIADARLRVRVRDADGNLGQDETDGGFQLGFPDLVGDLDGDGTVGFDDLVALLALFGPCDACPTCHADFDGDCQVGFTDLVILLSAWSAG